jgi:hypothetical protein
MYHHSERIPTIVTQVRIYTINRGMPGETGAHIAKIEVRTVEDGLKSD